MKRVCFLLTLLMIFVFGCRPAPVETVEKNAVSLNRTASILRIQAGGGGVEQDADGKVVAVDLAKERTSATDDVLREALKFDGLRRLRLAGGSLSADVFSGLADLQELEELYLQDISLGDEEIVTALKSLRKLKRLAFRRCAAVTDRGILQLLELPSLRNLALIDSGISPEAFRKIVEADKLVALDLRNCGRLQIDDYRLLSGVSKLADLKIGGFGVNDDVLTAIVPVKGLRGLTIEDSFISAETFKVFLEKSKSANSLETLVLNRNMTITDEALFELYRLSRLRRLTIGDMMVTGEFLSRLAEDGRNRPKLESLSLRKTLFSTESAAALGKYPELRSLDLSGIAVDAEMARLIASLSRIKRFDFRGCLLDEETETLLRGLPKIL